MFIGVLRAIALCDPSLAMLSPFIQSRTLSCKPSCGIRALWCLKATFLLLALNIRSDLEKNDTHTTRQLMHKRWAVLCTWQEANEFELNLSTGPDLYHLIFTQPYKEPPNRGLEDFARLHCQPWFSKVWQRWFGQGSPYLLKLIMEIARPAICYTSFTHSSVWNACWTTAVTNGYFASASN